MATSLTQAVRDEPLLNQMLYVDTKTWLPDDLLVKADKITMANSLELRVPLLDHQVLEFAASLPADFKVRGKETKRILKAAFAEELPAEVINRKKAGFPVPYETWLRKDFKKEVADILLSDQATARGYFKKNEVSKSAGGECEGREVFKGSIFAGGSGVVAPHVCGWELKSSSVQHPTPMKHQLSKLQWVDQGAGEILIGTRGSEDRRDWLTTG